jgi:hypothetical protein
METLEIIFLRNDTLFRAQDFATLKENHTLTCQIPK